MNEPVTGPPRISVVTIFYNAAHFLAQSIESVLAQDCDDWELLLVDDGSTDASAQIAEGYASQDERIKELRHPGKANRGMSASRNLGMNAARGELVAFIDADDRWRPNKLREQAAILARFPEVDACCGTVNYWLSWDGGQDRQVPTGHVQDRPIKPPEAALALYPLGKAAAPCPSDLMIRRTKALELGGFEESFTGPLQMYEDQAFLAKLYLQGTILFDSRCWLDYRRHDASCVAEVSRAGQYDVVRRHFLEWFANYLEERPHLRSPDVDAALKRAFLPYRHPFAGKILRRLGFA
jgi:glycosyltransferase involved in cell wall biosynthesis